MFDSLFPSHWSDIQKLMWLKILKGGTASYETIVGNPVSFTAKAAPLKQLKVAFSPVQDLHGYDNPWPAGGGKNKLGYLETGTYSIANVGSISYQKDNSAFTVDSTLTGAFGYRFGNKCKVTLAAGTYYLSSNVAGQNVGDGVFAYNVATSDVLARARAEGGASFTLTEQTEVSLGVSLKNGTAAGTYTFQIELGSSATSYAPYSNECPISGWSSLTVEQRGKNLLNLSAFSGTNIYTVNADGSITVELSDGRAWATVPVIPLKAGTYYITVFGATANSQYRTSDDDYSSGKSIVGTTKTTITLSADGGIKLKANISATYPVTIKILLTTDSSLTDFVPYNPSSRSISISLGSTVYSGVLDVVTGVGEITGVGYTIPPNRTNFYNNWCYSDCVRVDYGVTKNFTIKECNWLKIGTYSQLTGSVPTICIENGGYVYIGWDGMKTVMGQTQEAIRQYLTDHPLVITFDLPTPVPIQLTPQEVNSLAGDNVLFSDANGDLTVTYRSN